MELLGIDDKLFKKINARVKRRNARFKKMTRKEQRLTIAKDVVDMLRSQKLKPASTYLSLGSMGYKLYGYEDTKEGKEALKVDAGQVLACAVEMEQCEVCGIGSLFVAAIVRNDKMKLKKFAPAYENGDARELEVEYLSKWFDDDQLDLVEQYYEQNSHPDLGQRAGGGWVESPIYDTESDTDRLIMIMENIISNKGRFDPTKGKHKAE